MKKILVLLASLILATSIMAEKKEGQVEFGISGSYDITTTNGKFYLSSSYSDGTNEPGSGFSLAANINYFFNTDSAFIFGIGYQSYKPVLKERYLGTSYKLETDAAFINFQLGYRSYWSGLFLGLGFDLGLVSKYKMTMTDGAGFSKTFEVGDTVYDNGGKTSSNFDIYIELGYNIEFSQEVSMDLLAKYKIGLTNIYSNSKSSTVGGFDEIKMRVFQFQAGLNFAF